MIRIHRSIQLAGALIWWSVKELNLRGKRFTGGPATTCHSLRIHFLLYTRIWYCRRESNPQSLFTRRQIESLVTKTVIVVGSIVWYRGRGSNSQHLVSKTSASARLGYLGIEFGRCSRARTCDPLLPKQMRYQTALCTGIWSGRKDLNLRNRRPRPGL